MVCQNDVGNSKMINIEWIFKTFRTHPVELFVNLVKLIGEILKTHMITIAVTHLHYII